MWIHFFESDLDAVCNQEKILCEKDKRLACAIHKNEFGIQELGDNKKMKCYALLLLPCLVSANNMAFPPQPDEPKLQRLSDFAVFNQMQDKYVVLNFVSTSNNK